MKEKVQQVIDKIRPSLQADGGDVELIDVVDGIVTVKLQGACAGCPMSQMTLKNGNCNIATHITMSVKQEKAKLNPIKASKRG